MIYLYTGTPGSGKSLHVAQVIRLWLRMGNKVISTCNIDTRLCLMPKIIQWVYELSRGKCFMWDNEDSRSDNFTYMDIHDINPNMLYEHAAKYHIAGKEQQTLLVLDECVSIFSPTVLKDNIWNEWERFFQYHRHLGFEIILIPQSAKLISRKVIEYCEYEVKHRALKNKGFFGWVVSLLLGGLFSAVTYWRGIKKHISKHFFLYRYYLGHMYNSYAMFDIILSDYKRGCLTTLPKLKHLTKAERNKQIKALLMMKLRESLIERGKQLDVLEKTNNIISNDTVNTTGIL